MMTRTVRLFRWKPAPPPDPRCDPKAFKLAVSYGASLEGFLVAMKRRPQFRRQVVPAKSKTPGRYDLVITSRSTDYDPSQKTYGMRDISAEGILKQYDLLEEPEDGLGEYWPLAGLKIQYKGHPEWPRIVRATDEPHWYDIEVPPESTDYEKGGEGGVQWGNRHIAEANVLAEHGYYEPRNTP